MDIAAIKMVARPTGQVKWLDRAVLFQEYKDFCDASGFDGESYPIVRTALDQFCKTLDIGKKSRRARTIKRNLKDAISRPARLCAGVPPKSGPPIGRPDRNGVRHYYTLEQCRLAGYRSGAARRFTTRHRDTRIRQDVFKRGLTPDEAAQRAGVSVRTVYYVLKRPPVHRLAQHSTKQTMQGFATNNLRQATARLRSHDCTHPSDPAALATPEPRAIGPPRYARPAVALKLHWLRVVDLAVHPVNDARLRSIRARQAQSLQRDLRHYAAAVRRQDGPGRWDLVLAASRQWLDELVLAGHDPVLFLAKCNRGRVRPSPQSPRGVR